MYISSVLAKYPLYSPHRTILNHSRLTQDRLKLCSIYFCMFDEGMCLHKACEELSEFPLSTGCVPFIKSV